MDKQESKLRCGIIMPISELDTCNEQHWADVKSILIDAISNAGFEADLVSEADEIGILQKRIIQNIYENPIIVCDVSGKNPNVMFELGMRLAFDKPTIIIKDDKTSYTFDTSPIEHLEYPRDLRYNQIIDFKLKLASKIKGTYQKSCQDANYTTFLKHFGTFTISKLDNREVTTDEYILEEIKDIKRQITMYDRNSKNNYKKANQEDLEVIVRHEVDKYISSKDENLPIDFEMMKDKILEDSKIRSLALEVGVNREYVEELMKKIHYSEF